MARPRKHIRKCYRPGFMPGLLFDVWYEPFGRAAQRQKIGVTTDPKVWSGQMGREKLDALVRDGFKDLLMAVDARIRVTDRPEQKTVALVTWITQEST
jgi:hypothetical protein